MTENKSGQEVHRKADSQIWSELKEGYICALGILYDKYVDTLFVYGLNQSKDRDLVKDCIHDVFLEVYRYRAKLASTDNVKAYLFTCLGRKIHKKRGQKIIPLQTDSVGIADLSKVTVSSY